MVEMKFLSVGCGDTTVIITTNDTILIDCYKIDEHTEYLPANKVIKALFITHQHYDHFDGMEYLKDNGYSIEYLIYSPYSRRNNDNSVEYDEWRKFQNLASHFEKKGSKVYKPYRQDSFEKPWWTVSGLQIWMLGPNEKIASSATRELHDACLVFMVKNKSTGNKCCFTGDASDKNLNWIANNTTNYCNDTLHASHHGSINGADLEFIKNANIKDTIISTKSGTYQNVPHPTALKRYRDNSSNKVFRTDVDGTLTWKF